MEFRSFSIGTIPLRAHAAGDCELVGFNARNLMEHNPNHAGGYYAMAPVAQHEGNATTATQLFAPAQKFWSKADRDLPERTAIQKKTSN